MLTIESSDFEQADTLPAAAGHTSTTARADALADPCGGLRWHAETPGLYRMRLLPVIFTHTGSRARAAGHRGVCVCLWAAGRCRIDVDGQRDRAPGPARRPPFAHGGKRQSGAVPLMGRDRAAYFPVQQIPAAALPDRNSSKRLLALARKFFLCLFHKNSLLCTMSIFFFWATFPRPPAKYRHG